MRKSVSLLPGNEGEGSASTARVFGVPLEEVTRMHTVSGHEVPALVKHIVDYIVEHGHLDLQGLFLVNGNAERVDWLRRRYDSGEEVELEKEADLASAVSLLRLFLQELPEPVIPTALQGHILQLHQDYRSKEELFSNLKNLLQQLPQLNYCLLRFLCRFLSSVASLQQESWNIGALAAVFGPDIFHLSTEGDDLRDQESVSRVLAELLDNQEGLFDSDDEDISSTNDYSSLNEPITELLDDDKCEAECEELPQDSEEGPTVSDFHQNADDSPAASSHLSSISILPADSTDIIQRSIRAAVEHHLLELKSSINHDLSSYNSQGLSPTEPEDEDHHGNEEHQTDPEDRLCSPEKDVQQPERHQQPINTQDPLGSVTSMEEGSGMDIDTKAAGDADSNLNTASQDHRLFESMEQTITEISDSDVSRCDQNANTSETNRNQPSSCQQKSGQDSHLQLFPDNQWEDPVPAFKSWQDDSESGEAQLSPLAGRIVPLPLLRLEDDGEEEEGEGVQDDSLSSSRTHPHIPARRFLDFGAHSTHRFLQDSDATSPTKAPRQRRASFGSRDVVRGDSVTHQLTKKLQHLKKKIKQFEEQFEKERNYKPSHAEKAANPKVLKWMTDLTKIRRQIKDAKHCAESELGPQTRPRSNTLPKSFGSTLDQGLSDTAMEVRGPHPTREETLDLIQRRVKGKRQEDGWPDDIKKMTKEQLSCEKVVLQKNLLHYEGLHGRPVTKEERLVVKPLYERYRLVKQMLTRVSITPATVSPSSKRRTQTLQPIIEGETAHFWEEFKEEEEEERKVVEEEERDKDDEEEEEGESSGGEMQSPDVIMTFDSGTPTDVSGRSQSPHDGQGHCPMTDKMEEGSGRLALDLRLSSSNASSMPELLEQLWKARAEKKKLRKTIREFEEDFYQHNGRNVQKEDRVPMLEEYREYKRIKAKLRLLEVLISKQDSSKSI
ncbi:protein FAM13B isoform X16 [Oryzias latipes]|uniref:Family with sequence similarity 13 member B n=1 Tax=Oryzias latipes TaxID=8090 RepID=A0A3B3IEH1_ORYLA